MALFTKRYSRPGSAPGAALQVTGDDIHGLLSVMDFSHEELVEERNIDIEAGRRYLDTPEVTWLHVQGRPSAKLLNTLGDAYGLHTLALEDVIHGGQRTKVENFDNQYFVVLNVPVADDGGLKAEQVSFFLGETYVISIHQGEHDIWEPVRQRLRADPPRSIRSAGADYLLYGLLDTAIDHAFPLLEILGDELEATEETIFEKPGVDALDAIHTTRHNLIFLRRLLWPQRDMLNSLIRDESDLIQDRTKPYLRDCYDHTIQIIELVESYREVISSMHDLYLSSLSNRMNEVMKVLTMIATIFIPLSFVAGIYGMNFDTTKSPWNMPELGAYYGYPLLWLFMIGIAALMIGFFKRKGWF